MKKWSVSIGIEGIGVLFINSDGEIERLDNIEDYRTEILACVENIMGLMGVKNVEANVCPLGGLHDWTEYDVNMMSRCTKCGIDLLPF